MAGGVNMRTQAGLPDERRSKMLEVYKYGFMVDELTLFLDTHPHDQNALEAFREANKKYNEASENYSRMYGPLTVSIYDPDSKWCWNSGPMPWQGEV